jgi:hypothetical protein
VIRAIGPIDITWISTKSGRWSLDEVQALIAEGPDNMAITLTDLGARASELTDR